MRLKYTASGLLILLLLCASLFTGGCWNRRELNTLAIAVGMGIDKVGDEYIVSVQVVNPNALQRFSNSDHSEVVQYREQRSTIIEALRNMSTASPRKIYLSHIRILVLSEELAKSGIGEALDFISRDHEPRSDFYVMVARNTSASDILNVYSQLEMIPSVKVFDMIESAEKNWAATSAIRLDKLLVHFGNENGESAVLTGIQLIGNKQIAQTKQNIEHIRLPGTLKFSGLAVLNEDRLVGWLNEEQSTAYNYLINNVHSTVMTIDCPSGGRLTLEVVQAKAKLDPILKDGKLSITVKQSINANIGEVACNLDLNDQKTIKELEKLGEERLQSSLTQSISQVQNKFGADIFGFGKYVHRKHPHVWKQYEHNWTKRFRELPVNVDVQMEINYMGSINNSFVRQKKE